MSRLAFSAHAYLERVQEEKLIRSATL